VHGVQSLCRRTQRQAYFHASFLGHIVSGNRADVSISEMVAGCLDTE
jgi:hypothetical protein